METEACTPPSVSLWNYEDMHLSRGNALGDYSVARWLGKKVRPINCKCAGHLHRAVPKPCTWASR